MRKLLALFLMLGLTVAAFAKPESNLRADTLVLTHVTVIDATGAPAKPDMTVVIVGERIAAVGRSGKVRVPAGARVVEGAGKFLIPGLWDMHVHVASLAPYGRNEGVFFPLLVAHGVTGVRDMGGDLETLKGWRERAASGELIAPRIVMAGPMLDGYVWPASSMVANAGEGREAVASLKRRGADFVKVQSLLTREAYFAVASEAKRLSIPFAGHVPETVGAGEASDAGQKSIEHLTGVLQACSTEEASLPRGLKSTGELVATYSEQKAGALFARFRRNGTWQCPTLVWERGFFLMDEKIGVGSEGRLRFVPREWEEKIWKPFVRDALKGRTAEDRANLERRWLKELEVVGAMRRAGVEILAGTDTPAPYIFPGSSLHEELALLVRAGLTPLEALQTATRNPAKYLGLLDRLGTIERRKIADLVLLEADPLEDIGNTRKIAAVIIGGRFIPKESLDEMKASAEVAAGRR